MTFTGFQNLTLGIHNPAIFDVPDICKHAKAATQVCMVTFSIIPVHIKADVLSIVFRSRLLQTGLYNHRSRLEALNFVYT